MSAGTVAHQGLLWYLRRARFLLVTKVWGHIEYVSTKPNINSSSHLREPATIGADEAMREEEYSWVQMLNISDRVWSSFRCSFTPSSLAHVSLSVNIALHQLNIEGNKNCANMNITKRVLSLHKSLTTMQDIVTDQTHTKNVPVLHFLLAEVSMYYLECIPNKIRKDNSVYTRLKI